jgi:hypothetical protein
MTIGAATATGGIIGHAGTTARFKWNTGYGFMCAASDSTTSGTTDSVQIQGGEMDIYTSSTHTFQSLSNQIRVGVTIDTLTATVLSLGGGNTSTGTHVGKTGGTLGFYGHADTLLQTGVAVSAAGIHAALVNLGLITA